MQIIILQRKTLQTSQANQTTTCQYSSKSMERLNPTSLKSTLKLPGSPRKIKGLTGNTNENEDTENSIKTTDGPYSKLPNKEVRNIKNKMTIDLSGPQYQLESVDFLTQCMEIRELDLSGNKLQSFSSQYYDLTKVKHLIINNNALTSCRLIGLRSLESLSLQNNNLHAFDDLSDLGKVVNIDLSGNNMIKFEELSKLKSLKVLDLANNNIDLSMEEFKTKILENIRVLSKLRYLSFYGNPVINRIPNFNFFIITELPKLKYYDWDLIKKDTREMAYKLLEEGEWEKDFDKGKTKRTIENKKTQSKSKGQTITPLEFLDDVSEDMSNCESSDGAEEEKENNESKKKNNPKENEGFVSLNSVLKKKNIIKIMKKM